MIADGKRSHPGTDRLDDAATFMPKNAWKDAFRIGTRQREGIRVADTAGDDAHQNFSLPWWLDLDFGHFQRLPGSPGNGSTCFHHQ